MKPIIVAEKTEALDWIVYEKHATHMVSLGGGLTKDTAVAKARKIADDRWLSLQVIN